jgi:hypothetical protein
LDKARILRCEKAYAAQRFLVAGHMRVRGGHAIIARRHLRLASGAQATPHEAGQYLLFDAAQPIEQIDELTVGLASVYR